ncbi:hypothetical protein AOLI_G00203830 [Acnodon oligacanthus]
MGPLGTSAVWSLMLFRSDKKSTRKKLMLNHHSTVLLRAFLEMQGAELMGRNHRRSIILVKGREEEGETRWRGKKEESLVCFVRTSGIIKQKPPAFPHKTYL